MEDSGKGRPDPLTPVAAHLAVSILVPAAYCIAAAAIGSDVSPGLFPLTVFGAIAPALAAAFSAASSLAFERERVSFWGFVRSFVVFLIVLWPLQALLLPRPAGFSFSFRPDPSGLFLMADCAAAYLIAAKLRGCFRSRELFLESIRGQEDAKLRSAAREDGALSLLAFREMEEASSLSATVLLILLAAACLIGVIGRPLSPFLVASLAASTGAAFLVRAVVADFQGAHSLLCMGIVPEIRARASRLRLALAVVAALCVACPILAGDRPLFPYRWIATIWNSFALRFPAHPRALPPAKPLEVPPMVELGPNSPMPDFKPLIDLSAFLQILGRLLLALLAVAFALFLIAPLFSRSIGSFLAKRRPAKALAALIAFFRRLFSLLSGTKAQAPGMSLAERKRIEKRFESLSARKRNPEKEKETGRIAKAFLDLIARGAELGKPYRDSSVPVEWARSLAAVWPDIAATSETGGAPRRAELVSAAELFEAALYSEKLLGKEATDEYFGIVESALRR